MANGKPKTSTADAAKAALAMKKAAEADRPKPPESRTAGEGMHPIPNTDIAPSGALDAEGNEPVVNRSRRPR